jgi:hypothetical protein
MLNNTPFKSFIAFSIVAFSSCNYEKSANTKSFINNNTFNKVTIIPYYQGFVVKEDSVQINSNQLVLVLNKNEKGKGSGFSYPLYLAIYDSVLVAFDNSIHATHYSYATTNKGNNPKAIKIDSSRSIYNEVNYVRKIITESKRGISNEYTFTFTEQDYLDAKK